MMQQILRIRAIFVVAIKRLLAQRLLSTAIIVGLTVAVALILTIPIYSESVAFRILTERLEDDVEESSRPPFSYLVSYIGSWHEPVDWEDTEPLDTFLREQGGEALGLDIDMFVRHFETRNLRMYPAAETNYNNDNVMLDFVSIGTTEGIFDQIEIIEGRLPVPADPSPDSVVEVLIYEEFAIEYGIQIGEQYVTYDRRLEVTDPLQITDVVVAGIWRPLDFDAPYWFYRPNVFEDILLVPEETYRDRLGPYSEEEVYLGVWYLVADGSGVNTSRVDELILKNDETERVADQLLPGAYIQVSPVKELKPYQRITNVLTLTLSVFSIPIVALLVVFLVMIVSLVVDLQRNETAVLRSRGTSPFQVIGLTIVESTVTGIVALILGTGIAIAFTRVMGSTRSFMDFSYDSGFIVSMPPNLPLTILLALLFTVVIRVVPTITASRHTIISYKLNSARTIGRPLWSRLGLDILLLIVVGVFYYQVVQQGGFIEVQEGVSDLEQAYEQPIIFLLPPLTIFALSLFILRLLPIVLRFLVWIIQLTNAVGLLIVTRQLERTPSNYYLPLILLVSTVSLGIYTASFARTVDRYLYEQQFYRTSADIVVRVFSEDVFAGANGGSQDVTNVTSMHITEFTSLSNIEAATRFGEYPASARLTSGSVDGKFIGVDRAEIGDIMFWRSDFAPIRLGYLMNALAVQPDTVLVSEEFLDDNGLNIGDFLQVEISAGEDIVMSLQIVGTLDYFPRWYPEEDGALFVGNLDYLFEQAQTELSYRFIARVSPEFDERAFFREIISHGAAGAILDEPFSRIEREQFRPERQGLFGLLSIGFITSSLATMIGFLLYTIFAYQRRYVTLGILRAIGLSQAGMMFSVAWELGLLILMGLALGIVVGLAVSVLYIPYMQFVSSLSGIVPPYMITMAWSEILQIVMLFVVTFIVIMAILLIVLRRMRIFQAVKLGETL